MVVVVVKVVVVLGRRKVTTVSLANVKKNTKAQPESRVEPVEAAKMQLGLKISTCSNKVGALARRLTRLALPANWKANNNVAKCRARRF